MTPVTSPDFEGVVEAYANSPAWRSILDYFSSRSKKSGTTKVDAICNTLGDSVKRSEVIALFRRLEELGHGKFIEGRKTHPSRFAWTSSLIDVGNAAKQVDGLADENVFLSEADIAGAEPEEQIALDPSSLADRSYVPSSASGMRTYPIWLRPGIDAIIQIPTDLSAKEAERISKFLLSLAVPSDS